MSNTLQFKVLNPGYIEQEFCYGISEVPERYIRFLLISVINFYYVINKLIILVHDSH
jgi:hypothetical protein